MGTNTHDIIIGELRYRITENEAIVTGYYKPLKGELVIPETVEGMPVTEIADEALEHLQVTKLTAKSIRRAGRAGLRYCRNMEQIDMPQLEYIGDEALGCIHRIPELYLPSVVEVGKRAFHHSLFKKVNMPKLKHIGELAFDDCFLMKEAYFPSVERIDEFAFFRCRDLMHIDVKKAKHIAPHAFMGCWSLSCVESDCEYDNSNLADEIRYYTAHINPKKSGLQAHIRSEAHGIMHHGTDAIPSVSISKCYNTIRVSLTADAQVLYPPNWTERFSKQTVEDFYAAIEYVKRNRDIFMKHYNDTDCSYDDEDMFNELRERGEYK